VLPTGRAFSPYDSPDGIANPDNRSDRAAQADGQKDDPGKGIASSEVNGGAGERNESEERNPDETARDQRQATCACAGEWPTKIGRRFQLFVIAGRRQAGLVRYSATKR
jgi:hypothetical protein